MPEEPCQCKDCLRFYREHDRLIREFPTLRQQQEINWAALQSFRTLCGRVLEDLQKQINAHSSTTSEENLTTENIGKKEKSMPQVISDIENRREISEGSLFSEMTLLASFSIVSFIWILYESSKLPSFSSVIGSLMILRRCF